MAREIDLDRIAGEVRQEPVRVRVDGEWYEGPSELAYETARPFLRFAGRDPDAVPGDEVVDAIDSLMGAVVGEDVWQARAGRYPLRVVMEAVGQVVAEYGFAAKGATTEEALGESRASTRS